MSIDTQGIAEDGSLIDGEDPMSAVVDADERMASFVAALDSAGNYDAKRELLLQAIDDSQFVRDLRTLFGAVRKQVTAQTPPPSLEGDTE
jgi:hypothetical protein